VWVMSTARVGIGVWSAWPMKSLPTSAGEARRIPGTIPVSISSCRLTKKPIETDPGGDFQAQGVFELGPDFMRSPVKETGDDTAVRPPGLVVFVATLPAAILRNLSVINGVCRTFRVP